ncbi:MAG: ATP-binding cassette domain-containing protein [Methylococcaceae bacterium]|nr:MAG: ATP-binding cassette domain-containing protein [Methylococcaceae bacterium]
MSCTLNVNDLSFAFAQKTALEGVSFTVASGQCCILLGHNGAGKSTLFALITHLYDSGSGSVAIAGFDVKRQSYQALARLGVVFQQSTLDLDLSVLQNLRYHAALHGMEPGLADARIQEELERQGMYDRRKEKVRQLNGGHRRRVEIARALLHKPALLLLDEPTVGLDVPSRKAIVEYVHQLAVEQDIAVLWATHLIDEIHLSDQLIVLHEGSIRASGSVQEVMQAAKTERIAGAFRYFTGAGK